MERNKDMMQETKMNNGMRTQSCSHSKSSEQSHLTKQENNAISSSFETPKKVSTESKGFIKKMKFELLEGLAQIQKKYQKVKPQREHQSPNKINLIHQNSVGEHDQQKKFTYNPIQCLEQSLNRPTTSEKMRPLMNLSELLSRSKHNYSPFSSKNDLSQHLKSEKYTNTSNNFGIGLNIKEQNRPSSKQKRSQSVNAKERIKFLQKDDVYNPLNIQPQTVNGREINAVNSYTKKQQQISNDSVPIPSTERKASSNNCSIVLWTTKKENKIIKEEMQMLENRVRHLKEQEQKAFKKLQETMIKQEDTLANKERIANYIQTVRF